VNSYSLIARPYSFAQKLAGFAVLYGVYHNAYIAAYWFLAIVTKNLMGSTIFFTKENGKEKNKKNFNW